MSLHRLRITALLAALLLITGCRSESGIGLILNPNDKAAITVSGDNPFVTIDNQGPGQVTVYFAPNDLPPTGPSLLIRGSTGRTMRGGGEVSITNNSKEHANVHVEATNHTGLEVVSKTQPTRSE